MSGEVPDRSAEEVIRSLRVRVVPRAFCAVVVGILAAAVVGRYAEFIAFEAMMRLTPRVNETEANLWIGLAIKNGLLAIIPAISTTAAVLVLLRGWRSPDGSTRCGQCGYILKGLTEPRCPECGQQI